MSIVGGGGGVRCQTLFFCSPDDQQTKSGIGHRVEEFFWVGNQYAECEKQQQLFKHRYHSWMFCFH